MKDGKKDSVGWYSVQEAAEIYDIHPNTIRDRIRADKIPFRQVERSGRLVYEVAISDDDDAALLTHEQALGRLSDTISGLRSQLGAGAGHARAGRSQGGSSRGNRHDAEDGAGRQRREAQQGRW